MRAEAQRAGGSSVMHVAQQDETEEAEAAAAAEAVPRQARASADEARCQFISARVGSFVADMFSLLESLQAESRDTQTTTQERSVTQRAADGRTSHTLRVVELDRAIADRARAAESSNVADVLRWVGVGLSVAVGALGAVFTGGATLVAAVAIAVALTATCVLQGCAQAGVIGAEAASIATLVISAVATAVSLGCTTATLISAATSTATTVAASAVSAGAAAVTAAVTQTATGAADAVRSALEIAQNIAQLVQALNSITQGTFEIDEAVVTRDARGHETSATAHGQAREEADELRDEALEVLANLMRSFARVAESMAEVREEARASMRTAMRFA